MARGLRGRVRRLVARRHRPADPSRFLLCSVEGVLLNPIPIFAFNPGPITGDGNWTWLVPGRIPTLIDAGTGEGAHLAEVGTALAGADLHQVLVTHGHIGHASGAGALRERLGDTRWHKSTTSGGRVT